MLSTRNRIYDSTHKGGPKRNQEKMYFAGIAWAKKKQRKIQECRGIAKQKGIGPN